MRVVVFFQSQRQRRSIRFELLSVDRRNQLSWLLVAWFWSAREMRQPIWLLFSWSFFPLHIHLVNTFTRFLLQWCICQYLESKLTGHTFEVFVCFFILLCCKPSKHHSQCSQCSLACVLFCRSSYNVIPQKYSNHVHFRGFLACLPCIKPNTVFKILFSVPPRDPTTGQTHQRLKVNSGANQFSSLKHSSSASHCAITAQAYTHTYICTHMVNPHPSCYGGHDPM